MLGTGYWVLGAGCWVLGGVGRGGREARRCRQGVSEDRTETKNKKDVVASAASPFFSSNVTTGEVHMPASAGTGSQEPVSAAAATSGSNEDSVESSCENYPLSSTVRSTRPARPTADRQAAAAPLPPPPRPRRGRR